MAEKRDRHPRGREETVNPMCQDPTAPKQNTKGQVHGGTLQTVRIGLRNTMLWRSPGLHSQADVLLLELEKQ